MSQAEASFLQLLLGQQIAPIPVRIGYILIGTDDVVSDDAVAGVIGDPLPRRAFDHLGPLLLGAVSQIPAPLRNAPRMRAVRRHVVPYAMEKFLAAVDLHPVIRGSVIVDHMRRTVHVGQEMDQMLDQKQHGRVVDRKSVV